MKPALLYLCHRIPFPPNKGDKIRSFHVLKHLAKRYRIFLGAFIDDPADWVYRDKLRTWCEHIHFEDLDPRKAKLRSLQGLLHGQPLTLPYYFNASMKRWVDATKADQGISRMLIYSSSMAQYVLSPQDSDATRVIDFVDVDSDKWRQYAEKKRWPLSWIYSREARKLLGFEQRTAALFDASLFVSDEEAALFRQLAPESAGKISFFSNGVDIESFSPDRQYQNPYTDGDQQIVFTGAMDYWPNEDAVTWFADKVFPGVQRKWPGARFNIVGSRPTEKVQRLGARDGVNVTGSVPDIRPYVAHATAVVVPMRIARGIQNKVLEAMAMARPVIVTSMGLEGIGAEDGREVMVADEASEFVEKLELLFSKDNGAALGEAAREKVRRDFSWENTLPVIDQLIK